MNILMVNQPLYNRGDESAHKGLVRTLLRQLPDVRVKVLYAATEWESVRQFTVVSDRVEYVKTPEAMLKFGPVLWQGMKKGRTWLWHLHPSFVRFYKPIYQWADVVVCAPGGICMGGFQAWDHLFFLKLAKFYKRPLAYYGRSFGPFPVATESNRLFKKLSLEMIHYFSFLSIRDHKTELLAEELGVPYVSTVDSAFLDSPMVDIPYEVKCMIGAKRYMVFVPNYLLWHYAYRGRISYETLLDFYCRVMDEIWAADSQLQILMLPQLFCGKTFEFSDVDFFRALAERKGDSRLFLTADCYSSDIQQRIIAGAEYLIGARYHSIVFAVNQGVPFISLSYEHKMEGMLESLGKGEWCVDFSKTLESEAKIDACLSRIRALIPSMHPDLDIREKAKKKADHCMDCFVDFLNQKNNSRE